MPPTSDQELVRPELICPAGTPAALRTAVDAGADAVYCGFQNATNVRNFPGLNFTPEEMEQGIAYAHGHGTKVLLVANTFPPGGNMAPWQKTIDYGAEFGVDAVIIADFGVADYAARTYPELRLHLSVQASASSPEAIKFFAREFNVKRVVLPRILTVREIRAVTDQVPVEIETFIFGNVGMMAEGRCALSNYATGISTNMDGVCSPPSEIRYEEDRDGTLSSKLGEFTIDRFGADEKAGYPTICKGRYVNRDNATPYYAFDEPHSLNLSELLPELVKAGVSALKIEGRQRSRAYVKAVVSGYRQAVDNIMAGRAPDLANLLALTEGSKQTKGAYETKTWR